MAFSYAHIGPPFNFLGNLSESQKNAFTTWVSTQSANLSHTQIFRQVRAHQLRKSAGMLEAFYVQAQPDNLVPTFVKASWTPSPDGHWAYAQRNDHAPAMVVAKIKRAFQTQLVHQDDAVFHMNHMRAQIEKQEDLAQHALEAQTNVPNLILRLQTLFQQPEYQAALVRDLSDTYKGQQRFRSSQLDAPTAWERDTRSCVSPTLP